MATWLLKEIKKADIKAILDFPLPNRKEMLDIAPTLLNSFFTRTSAHKIEALERQELASYNELLEGNLLNDTPYGKLLNKYISADDLQKYEEILSVEINKTIAHMEETPFPDIPEQDIELFGKRTFQITSRYEFVKWNKEDLFSKLKFAVTDIIEDEETGIAVITVSWENTDKNIVIDGHIIAELYDENNLLVGTAFFSFPKMGTASPYSNGEFTSIVFNVLKSNSYNVVFKPYCLWEIKPKEIIKATTVDELVDSNVGFDMADLTDLEIDYEIKKMESAKAKGIKEYSVDRLVAIKNDLVKKIGEDGVEEKLAFVTEKINDVKSSHIQLLAVKDGKLVPANYIPLDKDSNTVKLFKGATQEQINAANKIGHEKFIMYEEQERAEFEKALRDVRQMGDIIAGSAMVEREHDWATWGVLPKVWVVVLLVWQLHYRHRWKTSR